jgi:hypothetical protein
MMSGGPSFANSTSRSPSVCKKNHDPRFAIEWSFDLGELDGWLTGEENDESWAIFTRKSMRPSRADLLVNSSA